jgi:hypothetical protein
MTCHISLFKNNSENLRSMTHQLMQRHISPLKNNSKNSRKLPHPISHFSIEKYFKKNSRKMYCNSLRVINDEFSQHASIHHLSPLKN